MQIYDILNEKLPHVCAIIDVLKVSITVKHQKLFEKLEYMEIQNFAYY